MLPARSSISRELAGRQRDQIGRVRHIVAPMKGAGLRGRIRSRADQRAVGNRGEFFRHSRDDFAGGPIVGVVVAGKPVARVLVLALRPRLPRLVRDRRRRGRRSRVRAAADLNSRSRSPFRHRIRERAASRCAACRRRSRTCRLAADAHRLDFQFGGVEFDPVERAGDRGQPMRRGAGDFLRVEVERDFQLDVADVDVAIARPLRLDVLRLKRVPSTSEGDGERLVVAKLHRQLIEKSRLMHGRDVMNRGTIAQTGKLKAGLRAPRPRQG